MRNSHSQQAFKELIEHVDRAESKLDLSEKHQNILKETEQNQEKYNLLTYKLQSQDSLNELFTNIMVTDSVQTLESLPKIDAMNPILNSNNA